MTRFFLLLRALEPFLYALAGLGILLGVRSFWNARQRLNYAQFSLEREQAEEQGGWAITQTLALGLVALLVFFLTGITFSAWQTFIGVEQTPTPLASPAFGTLAPGAVGEGFVEPTRVGEEIILIRTPRPSPTPAGTLRPADAPLGCIEDQASIDIPDNGQVIFETEPIIGTANIENFGYYRFEIRSIDQSAFGVIGGATSDYTVPVTAGPLGSIVPQNFAPGEYRFRMTVFDATGTMRAACEITIFLSDPLPTSTPIGGGIDVPPTISSEEANE